MTYIWFKFLDNQQCCALLAVPQQLREDSSKMFLYDECKHSSYPRILIDCVEDPFEDVMKFSLLVEGVQNCTCGDLVAAFALMFATYYIYNLSYPDAIQSTITFFQTSFLKIEDIFKKDYKVSRLMTTLSSVWTCINLKNLCK